MDPATVTNTTKEVVQYEPNVWGSIAMIPLLFVIFYFFIIKPQSDKEKKKKETVNSLKKGDRILTAGGIFGNVFDIKDEYIVVKISNDVKVEVSKDAITVIPESNKN